MSKSRHLQIVDLEYLQKFIELSIQESLDSDTEKISESVGGCFDWDIPEFDWSIPEFDWSIPEFDWDIPEFDWSIPELDWDTPELDLA